MFWKTGLAGLGTLLILITLIAYNTAVYGLEISLPNQHVGGFLIEAKKIQGSDFFLMPWINDTNSSNGEETHLVVRVTMNNLRIQGLKITKVMHSPAIREAVRVATGGAYDALKIQICSSDENAIVRGDGLVMDASAMTCNLADFDLIQINSPTSIEACVVTITDAQMITHYQSARSMTIPFMNLKVEPCSSSEDPCL